MTADTLAALAGFWLVHLAAVVSPGPSLVVVSRAAVAGSTDRGVAVAAGLALGTFVWAAAALFGLSVLFAVLPASYTALRVAGAAFLIVLAWRLWRGAAEPLSLPGSGPAPALTRAAALRLGVWTQLANPKVAVFFGSVFAAVLPPAPSPATTVAVLAIVCLNELLWYSLVALALSRPAVRERYVRAKSTIDRATGAVLGALGLRLLVPD